MKRRLAIFLTLLMVVAASAHAGHAEKQAAYLDEVLRLSHEGVPDVIVLKMVAAMDFHFRLNADDVIELRNLGVSDEVIEALLDTALEEFDDDASLSVRFSAGYYSPWYRYPTAWGYYYDPFPTYYSYHYYPFHYYRHSYGWYGWCGSSYYYGYNWHDYNRGYHHDSRDYDHGSQTRYRVAGSGRAAERVRTPGTRTVRTPRARVVPGSDQQTRTRETTAARPRVIRERVSTKDVRAARRPYNAERVKRLPRSRGRGDEPAVTPGTSTRRGVRDSSAPSRVRRPDAERIDRRSPATSTRQPRVQPRRNRQSAPAVKRPPRSTPRVQPPSQQKRQRPSVRPKQRSNPPRVTTPPRSSVRAPQPRNTGRSAPKPAPSRAPSRAKRSSR